MKNLQALSCRRRFAPVVAPAVRAKANPPSRTVAGLFAIGAVLSWGVPAAAAPVESPGAAPVASEQLLRADSEVREFYERLGSRRVWTPEREAELQQTLARSHQHGLELKGYGRSTLDPLHPDQREIALTEAALTYARALAHGATDPSEIHAIYTLPRHEADVVAGLQQALAVGDIGGWFAGLAPQDAEYQALSEAYVRARRQVGSTPGTSVAAGPLIRPGDHDPRVPQVAEALRRLGVDAAPSEGAVYGPELVRAVETVQQWGGVTADGVIGPDTLRILNAGAYERARRLAVNLERRRWLARERAPERIEVNIAAAKMGYFRAGQLQWEGRVVAGAPGNETPLLGERFDRLVLNPPWYVPQSIAQAEILPKGSDYLQANDMYVENGRVIQRPGPQAALGRVKFDMTNPYAIYLHDTPAKALFSSDRRHRSHGCVRVEDAVEFARRLAVSRGLEGEFEAQLASGQTRTLDLGEPVAVRLIYHTASVENGLVALWPDIYGWDDRLAEKLGLGKSSDRPKPAVATVLLGP